MAADVAPPTYRLRRFHGFFTRCTRRRPARATTVSIRFRLPLGPSLLGDVLPKRVIDGLSFNGYEAVFVFFVISGFVITRRSLERYGSLDALRWRHFYALRAARIFPLLLLLLAVLAVMHLSHMFVVLAVTPAYLAAAGGDMRWTFFVYLPVLVVCTILGGMLQRYVGGPVARRLSRHQAHSSERAPLIRRV